MSTICNTLIATWNPNCLFFFVNLKLIFDHLTARKEDWNGGTNSHSAIFLLVITYSAPSPLNKIQFYYLTL
jgi:hypothetical protein